MTGASLSHTAFFTPTGLGTIVEIGNFPMRFNSDKTVAERSKAKRVESFHGRSYVMEESIVGDVALVKAWKGDTLGNLVFRGSARNFNPEVAK
jgi:acyl CoA:acetate/3-ketoacid CoA transferase alpha subunit